MINEKIAIARVYMMEHDSHVKTVLEYIEHKAKIRGYTVFKAAKGKSEHHESASFWWDDLSLQIPIVIEFFDTPDIVKAALEVISKEVKPKHTIWWEAHCG